MGQYENRDIRILFSIYFPLFSPFQIYIGVARATQLDVFSLFREIITIESLIVPREMIIWSYNRYSQIYCVSYINKYISWSLE